MLGVEIHKLADFHKDSVTSRKEIQKACDKKYFEEIKKDCDTKEKIEKDCDKKDCETTSC